MAKRFTDSTKWAKSSFCDLSVKMKLVWIYLCDNCDHAGVWDINLKLLNFHIGETTSLKEIQDAFGDKIEIRDSKIIIPSFIDFQYGNLNPENRVHLSIIKRIERLTPNKALSSPIQGAMDKDLDKEMDKDISLKSVEKLSLAEFESAYAEYPRKEKKSAGLNKLKSQIKTREDLELFKIAIKNYRAKKSAEDPKFLMHFSTFVSDWRDWLDPETGSFSQIKPKGIAEILAEDANRGIS